MPSAQQSTSPYALYLQATRTTAPSQTERRQWIVVPPLLGDNAVKAHATPTDTFLVFTRSQNRLENRVKWRYAFVVPRLLERDLPDEIRQLIRLDISEDRRWDVSPIMTTQVTPLELKALIDHPATPYGLLRRFEKIARSVHNIAI